MSFPTEQQNKFESSHASAPSAVLRVIILTLFAVVTAIVAVSFAANHMRNGFEKEYISQVNIKTEQLAATSSLLISGDEIAADPIAAQTKYKNILPALMIDSMEKNQSRKIFGLYQYANGALTPLLQSSETGLLATSIPVSDWLTTESDAYEIVNPSQTTVLTPIKDSQGKVVGLFELSSTYSFLDNYGNLIERRILMTVMLSISVGIILFSLQYAIPAVIRIGRRRKEKY